VTTYLTYSTPLPINCRCLLLYEEGRLFTPRVQYVGTDPGEYYTEGAVTIHREGEVLAIKGVFPPFYSCDCKRCFVINIFILTD
jgi:hypothetical protein